MSSLVGKKAWAVEEVDVVGFEEEARLEEEEDGGGVGTVVKKERDI